MTQTPRIFLIDNGSLRADAVWALRGLAAQLSERSGVLVEPVSLLHSSKVPSAALGGVAAQVVKPTLRRLVQAGERTFVFVPLFLGPSRAISDYLPQLITEARELAPDLNVVVADTLAGRNMDAPDKRLAEMLVAHVRQAMQQSILSQPKVAMVDHGTPAPEVNRVRNSVAAQMAELLQQDVLACSMERRDGAEYDFNQPLLEQVDQLDGWGTAADVVLALFFLLPGRHAGADGDVAEICDGLTARGAVKSVVRTALLHEHPRLLDLLADRLAAALDQLAEKVD